MTKFIEIEDVELRTMDIKVGAKGGYDFTVKGYFDEYPADLPNGAAIQSMEQFRLRLSTTQKVILTTKADRQGEMEFNAKQVEADLKPKPKATKKAKPAKAKGKK